MNATSLRILVGLVIGLAAGAWLNATGSGALPTLLAFARPVGKLWLDALTMTVVPLVFSLLVTGVASTVGESRRAAARSMAWFGILLLAAAAVGAIAATAALELWPIGAGARPVVAATPLQAPRAADWLTGFIPSNPIKAAADTAITPLVVFALLFGFAATRIDERLRLSLVGLFRAVAETMLVIVHWVLLAGPIGVLALAFVVSATLGAGAVGALAQYVALVCAVGLLVTLLAYGVAAAGGRLSPLRFGRVALPAQVVALSTQSSLASLPAMIEAAPGLGVSEDQAAVVLPMAVSVFRAASVAMNLAVAVYLAHFHGVAVGPAALATGVVVGAVVSLAAVGLPAQVSFFASTAPICLAIGAPIGLLPILLAVESVPDIFRTVGNVTSDLAVTRLAARSRFAAERTAGGPDDLEGGRS